MLPSRASRLASGAFQRCLSCDGLRPLPVSEGATLAFVRKLPPVSPGWANSPGLTGRHMSNGPQLVSAPRTWFGVPGIRQRPERPVGHSTNENNRFGEDQPR